MQGLKVNGVTYEVGGGSAPVVLWENQSPSASFAAQTITLSDDVENYDYIGVIFAYGSSSANARKYFLPMVMIPTNGAMGATICLSTYRNYRRNITNVSGKSVTFDDGTYYATYGTNTATTGNTYIIPRLIIGFKN